MKCSFLVYPGGPSPCHWIYLTDRQLQGNCSGCFNFNQYTSITNSHCHSVIFVSTLQASLQISVGAYPVNVIEKYGVEHAPERLHKIHCQVRSIV